MLPVNEIMVYVPKKKEFLYIMEGSGLNLNDEDLELGYIDYVYIKVYEWNSGDFTNEGDFINMLTVPFDAKYNDYEALVKDQLDFVYEDDSLDYIQIESPINKDSEELEETYGIKE
jgi:hypothetical protein